MQVPELHQAGNSISGVNNTISGLNCDKQDKCLVPKSQEDKFFFSVYVHKDFSDLEVVVEASNLAEVECVTEAGCGGTVVNTGLDDGE